MSLEKFHPSHPTCTETQVWLDLPILTWIVRWSSITKWNLWQLC